MLSHGRRTGITRGNGTSTSYAFDPVSRLASTTQDLSGTAHDQTIGSVTYNPANQIQSQAKSNDAYAWSGHYNVNRNYTVNGRNQQTAAGATALGYDARGNLTTSGSSTYGYNRLNQMTSGPNGVTLNYDPAQRLSQITSGAGTTRFAYAGSALIQESNGSGVILRRYVPGPGVDEPVVWYEGSGTADRRWLHGDERGSVIAVSNGSGAMLAINRYDEYGILQSTNAGRFQYTGQAWLPELGMYYYKARMYSPTLSRFMQTDPIGYRDGMNWYNYVGSDPVNRADPSGLESIYGFCRKNGPGTEYVMISNSDGNDRYDPGETIYGRGTCPDLGITVTNGSDTYLRDGAGGGGGGGPQKKEPEDKWDKFKDCAAAQYGFGDGETPTGLDFGKMVSEVGALPIPKSLVGVPVIRNSSRVTNAVSLIPHKLGIRLNTGMQILGSGRVFGVLGRANVVVGSAMLAWDAASIAICTARE